MINAIFYDLDGTLLDSMEDLSDALGVLLRRFGEEPAPPGAARELLKKGSRNLVVDSVKRRPAGMSDAELYEEFNREYEKRLTAKTAPFPGIVPMLGEIRGMGLRQAVLSNKKGALTEAVCRHYFGGAIDLALGTIPLPRKPDPGMLRQAMASLRLSPEEVLYVGDTRADREAAANAGIRMLWVRWGYGDAPPGAEVLERPEDLPELVRRLR